MYTTVPIARQICWVLAISCALNTRWCKQLDFQWVNSSHFLQKWYLNRHLLLVLLSRCSLHRNLLVLMYVRVIIGTTSYCNQAYLIALLLCSSGDNVAAGPSWRWFIVAMLMLPVSERVSLGDYWYAVPPSKLPMLVQHSIFYLSALIIQPVWDVLCSRCCCGTTSRGHPSGNTLALWSGYSGVLFLSFPTRVY